MRRKVRLRGVWVLVVPFLWFADPTPRLLLVGGFVAALGLLVRGWAAGVIRKEKELAVGGPYAFTRNPLYVGTLLLGLGVTIAGGEWIFVVLFLAFYAWVYGRTIRREAELMDDIFGEAYRHYASRVPLLLPRVTRYRPPEGSEAASFTLARYRRNREYEALLGTIAGFAFLAAKMWWRGGV